MGSQPLERPLHAAPAVSVAASSDGPKKSAPQHLKRQLTLWDAVSMVVGIILGSGIFVAPAAVAALAPSVGQATLLWGVGALVAGCGALCYTECAARLPRDGGFFIFYERAFGWRWAFVAGWAALGISYPTSLAGVTLLGTQYLDAAIPQLAHHPRSVALATLTATALLNALGVPLGQLAQRFLTWAKVAAVLAVLVAALWWGDWQSSLPAPVSMGFSNASIRPLLMGLATLMWTYDGWTDITMVAGEIKNPERNLVRAVVMGLAILFGVYAAVQTAVMVLLGPARAAGSEQVLADALALSLGPYAEATVAWLVLLTTCGSVHGLMFATSRLAFAMAERGALPQFLARIHPRLGVPLWSILGVWAISCLYVCAKSFAELLEIFALIIWLFYGATAIALWRLRRAKVGRVVSGMGLDGQLAPTVLLMAACLMTGLQFLDSPMRAAFVLTTLVLSRLALGYATRHQAS